MLGNAYENQSCSLAAALEVVGERWSLLIVRDVFLGLRRFDEIQAELGIARNVLQARLTRLVEQGVLEKRLYSEHPPRFEYRLTDKGLDLWPSMVALMQWGNRYGAPDGPPVLLEHRGCGGGRRASHLRELRSAPVGARRAGAAGTRRDAQPPAAPRSPAGGVGALRRAARGVPLQGASSSRATSSGPSRAIRERATTRSKPAHSARSRAATSTCE